jgi:hypothetical protein
MRNPNFFEKGVRIQNHSFERHLKTIVADTTMPGSFMLFLSLSFSPFTHHVPSVLLGWNFVFYDASAVL